jgi:thiosulfate dehydrogenase (quinone) large subunit
MAVTTRERALDPRTTPAPETPGHAPTSPPDAPADSGHDRPAVRRIFAATRISLGWVFLWAFLDKTFGLGFATERADAWVDGGSPTYGFLTFGTNGPFADAFGSIAGAAWADWLFMVGLLGIGVALIAGVGMKIAAVSGAVMMVLMWAAAFPVNNPFMDDHIVYALVLVGLALARAGRTWGFGERWSRTAIVRRFPVLE